MLKQKLVKEFVEATGAPQADALSCLTTWNWDLPKALIDYRDTSTTEYLSEQRPEEPPGFWSTQDVEKLPPAADGSQSKHSDSGDKSADGNQGDFLGRLADKKLARRISKADDNVHLVSQARGEFSRDPTTKDDPKKPRERLDPDYTFSLPDLFVYPDNFRRFLERDLIENSTLVALEQAHRLNWWTNLDGCTKMWPLSTTGDGNCLLHAASLAIWGFHDRKLSLRSELFHVMSSPMLSEAFERRWRFQQTRVNKSAGFVFSDAEWRKEWEALVLMSSPEPREVSSASNLRRCSFPIDRIDSATAVYESLEEIHVLVLAHVLKRTIIVIADTVLRDLNGEAMAPIPFGGIYMPLEVNPNECQREPLILAYDMAHFSALVRMDTRGDRPNFLAPLTDNTFQLLPIQFGIDPGRDFDWSAYDGTEGNYRLTEQEKIALLSEYMSVVTVHSRTSSDDTIYRDWAEEDALEKEMNDIEISLAVDETDQPATKERNAAGKQLHSVAKQFGSIGKNMSKKIKKNIESITKMGGSKSTKKYPVMNGVHLPPRTSVACAQIRVKHHDFYEAMIKNYLECAQERFIECEVKEEVKCAPENGGDFMVNCVSEGCVKFGTVDTSYLCPECYENQKQREFNSSFYDQMPRYGTGNSKFYTQADMESHKKITRIPSVKRLNELDQTLYLSNSTFFNDKLAPSDPETFLRSRQDKTALVVAKETRRQNIASIYDNLCPDDCNFQSNYCTKCTDLRHGSKEIPDISL
ncbi:OTU domain-containing protein 7B-like [Phlebotomus argentipes]|uniref:OTU domain-containing protein 7B-like n=1 Tax=Phlebotomus argentipes TaxID=94469 RepID=UPI0028934A16|nr:OTU domain-containing protein 7B-like [Phlebotomus argentipes]